MLRKDINKQMGGFNYIVVELSHADNNNSYGGLKVVSGIDNEGNEIIDHQEPHNWFPLDDTDINLNVGEKEYLQGLPPRIEWLKPLTQQWLTEQGIEFTTSMTEQELIDLIPE